MSDYEIHGKVTVDDEASGKMNSIGKSTKDLIVGFSGLASGAINLYNSYDRVQNAGLQVEKSELAVKRATESLNDATKKHVDLLEENKELTDDVAEAQADLDQVQSDSLSSAEDIAEAQEKLNDALEKLADNKSDTESAIKDIEIAEDNLKVKTEQAEQAAENQKLTIITAAATAIPSIISIADQVWKLKGAWDAAKIAAAAASGVSAVSGAAGATSGVGGIAAGLGGAAAGVTAGGAAMVALPAAAVVGGALVAGYGYGLQKQQLNDAAAELGAIRQGKMPAPNITHPNGLTQAQLDEYKQIIIEEQKQAAISTGPKKVYMPGKGWVTVSGAQEGAIVNQRQIIEVGEAGPEAIIPLDRLGNVFSTNETTSSTVYEIRPTVNLYGDICNGVTLNQVMDMVNRGVGNSVSQFEAERLRRKNK